MKKQRNSFLQHMGKITLPEILFLVFTLVLFLLRMLYWEIDGLISVFWVSLLVFPLCLFMLIALIVCAVLTAKKKGYRLLYYLPLLLLPLLPVDVFYENVRFALLRPAMEQAATQIAESYSTMESEDPISPIQPLPAPYRYLSRGGEYHIAWSESGIDVSFYKWRGLMGNYMHFTYHTEIPYKGTSLLADTPHGSRVLQMYPLADNWSFIQYY